MSTSYEEFSSLVWQAQGSAGLMLFWQLDPDTALNLDPQARAQAGRRQTDQQATRRLPGTQSEDRAQRIALRAWQASEAAQHRRAELMQPSEMPCIRPYTQTLLSGPRAKTGAGDWLRQHRGRRASQALDGHA